MKQLRKLLMLCMVVWSVFLTGCDAGKLVEIIQKVVTGIEKALPAIKEVANTIQNIADGTNTATNTPGQATDQVANNGAGVTIPTAGDQENIGNGTTAGTAVGSVPPLTRPTGRAAIERTFGAAGTNQVTVQMAAGPNGSTKSVTCHRLLASRFKAVFDEIKALGLSHYIKSYDGCFVNRNKRGGSNPSTHAWGIAIDINASANPMGSSVTNAGQQKLAEVFNKYGFYQLPNDLMHFQYCRGY